MTESFDSWTAYDDWLIENYEKYAITSVNETEGKIAVEYMDKEEWKKEKTKENSN